MDNRTHNLKTWPSYFLGVMLGTKTFEVRKNDRDFQVGDILNLQEFTPSTKIYTGREIQKQVTYILKGGDFGIAEDTVVLGLSPSPVSVSDEEIEQYAQEETDGEAHHIYQAAYRDGKHDGIIQGMKEMRSRLTGNGGEDNPAPSVEKTDK